MIFILFFYYDNVIGIEIALYIVFWVAFLPSHSRHLT
jgi:hypothetical protein